MDQATFGDLKTAYLTGFFDGEGCVTIGQNGNITLRVINTNHETLKEFVTFFGGTIGNRSQIVNKKQYTWSIYGQAAIDVAKKMLHFSIEKREQLFALIDYFEKRCELAANFRPQRTATVGREELVKEYRDKLTKMKKGIVNG